MAIFLVVKVLSLNAPQTTQIGYKTLDIPANFVLAGFGGQAATAMPQAKDGKGAPVPGVFEVAIPAGSTAIEVTVKDSGDTLTVGGDVFWNMTQQLTLQPTNPPTLKFTDGQPQHVNVRNLDNHIRGSDFNVEVFVVLGHLRDGFQLWSGLSGLDFSFQPADILHFSTPVLNPSGVGINQVNLTVDRGVSPRGDLLFAERTTVPKMVVIYRPKQFIDLKYPTDRPYPYHIFFHPFPSWPDPYPGGSSYGDLAQRYMLTAVRSNPKTGQTRDQGKHLVHQHVDGGDKMILVFPVGSNKDGFQNLSTQTETFRLLQEINYWAQRLDQKLFPVAPIGQVALSGFSFGITYAASIIMGAQNPLFFDTLLKEVYSFDGVFQEPVIGPDGKPAKNKDGSPQTKESPKDTAKFCDVLKTWFRGGSDQRSIRIYTQRRYWFDNLKDADSAATLTDGPNGAKELESSSVSIVLVPSGKFWNGITPGITAAQVHQEIPARFAEHAIDRSPLAAGPPLPTPKPPAGVLTVTTLTPLTNGVVNKPYPTTTLAATGGTAPLTWQLKSGALPPGIQMSTDGVLTGTPTAEGKSTFEVEVDDDGGQKAFKQFDLTIVPSLCFIMTAAHGTPLSPDIQFLWNLRESVLQPTEWGRQFFQDYWKHYYRISPPIAEEMKRDPELRDTIRWTIVEPWTHYIKLLLSRPDWDKVDFDSLDPSVREFLQLLRGQMDAWLSEIPLPLSFAGRNAVEAVKELNVALTYVVRTGGAAYLDKLTELGELPLQFAGSERSQLRDMLAGAGRSPTEIDRILGLEPF